MKTVICYDQRQSIDVADLPSPSAQKPERFIRRVETLEGDVWTQIDVRTFNPVTRDDLYLVHSKAYVDGVFDGTILNGFENNDRRIAEACLWTVGSIVEATERAFAETMPVCSPTSGFHHAGHDFGGGFCTFNGLTVAAKKFILNNPGKTVAILDCDHHYGDGTQHILDNDTWLAGRVVHHTSGRHFQYGSSRDDFFDWLNASIKDINAGGCDVTIYQAGGDMHIDDPLGGILDDRGMRWRDQTVFRGLRSGIAWNLAGGYRKPVDRVIDTHIDTLRASIASSASWRSTQRARQGWRPGDNGNLAPHQDLRESFADYLETRGYRRPKCSSNGYYQGSHIQDLWDCYLHATLKEREKNHAAN